MALKNKQIAMPDSVKHYDFRKWLLNALDQLNAEEAEPDSVEVTVYVPGHIMDILGMKKFDKIMIEAINEKTEDGNDRYTTLKRVVAAEGSMPLDILLKR